MLKNKIIYLTALAACLCFWVFYYGYFSFFLFLSAVLVPLASAAVTAVAKIGLSAGVALPEAAVTRGDGVEIDFWVENSSLLPLGRVKLKVVYQNLFVPGAKPCKELKYVTVNGRQKKTLTSKISSEHCGTVRVALAQIYVYDYFGIFRLRKKTAQTVEITVLPAIIPPEGEAQPELLSHGESDRFSSAKSGDDPSEVFEIRDFRDGDRLQRIHWKLSMKQGHFMVRDFSLPLRYSALLALNLREGQNADVLLEAFVSVSYFYITHEIEHEIAWYNHQTDEYCVKTVTVLEDLFEVIGSIFEIAPFSCDSAAPELLAEQIKNKKYSRVLYFCPLDFQPQEYGAGLKDIENSAVVCAVDPARSEEIKQAQKHFAALSVGFIPISEGSISECLAPAAFV